MLRRASSPVLPSYDSVSSLSQSFATFFSDKLHKLRTSLLSNHALTSIHIQPPFTLPNFSSFTAVTLDEVSKPTSADLSQLVSFLINFRAVLFILISKV
jgi:hypothetical protein